MSSMSFSLVFGDGPIWITDEPFLILLYKVFAHQLLPSLVREFLQGDYAKAPSLLSAPCPFSSSAASPGRTWEGPHILSCSHDITWDSCQLPRPGLRHSAQGTHPSLPLLSLCPPLLPQLDSLLGVCEGSCIQILVLCCVSFVFLWRASCFPLSEETWLVRAHNFRTIELHEVVARPGGSPNTQKFAWYYKNITLPDDFLPGTR